MNEEMIPNMAAKYAVYPTGSKRILHEEDHINALARRFHILKLIRGLIPFSIAYLVFYSDHANYLNSESFQRDISLFLVEYIPDEAAEPMSKLFAIEFRRRPRHSRRNL